MSISTRLTHLAALLIEGSISTIERDELNALPLTRPVVVKDPIEVTTIIESLCLSTHGDLYVAGTLTVRKDSSEFLVFKYQNYRQTQPSSDTDTVQRTVQAPIRAYPISKWDVPVRQIVNHVPENTVSLLKIHAPGNPTPSGRADRYEISGIRNRLFNIEDPLVITMQSAKPVMRITNGVTIEALAAIVIDQLRGLQAGPHPCEENHLALQDFESGLAALHSRTITRISQGVINTPVPHVQGDLAVDERLATVRERAEAYKELVSSGYRYVAVEPLVRAVINNEPISEDDEYLLHYHFTEHGIPLTVTGIVSRLKLLVS